MPTEKKLTGYPSIDKPWLKYYTEEAINATLPECTIYEYLWENAKNYMEDIALVFFNKKITYREMFANIDKTAKAFTNIGVKEGDVVTLLMLNQPEMVYAFYALNKIGACACVVNVLANEKDLVKHLSECNSKYFVALDLFFEKSYNVAKECKVNKLIYLPLYESLGPLKMAMYRTKVKKPQYESDFVVSWHDFYNQKTTNTFTQTTHKEKKCTLIGHTGGTTGVPKGIELTDNSVNFLVAQYGAKWPHERKDVFLNLLVPFAVYGLVLNVHMPLSFGMKCVLIPKVDPKTTDKLVLKYKPNHIISVPSYWNAILESKKIKDLSFFKVAGAGGSKMEPAIEIALNKKFRECNSNIHFMNGYGMSEVGSIACAQSDDCAEIGSVGIPLTNTIIAAFDPDTGNEMKYNEEGEICILSPSMMIGYIDNPEENAQMMREHKDGKIWLHTGDLGYVNENGSVFIKGRMKRIYFTQQNGTVSKIFPDRIEKAISAHKEVSSCCAVCYAVKENSYLPLAFVVLKDDCRLGQESVAEELKALCKAELPEYSQPIAYHFCDALPLTSVGKVDYRALEERAKQL